jgi:radical SAM-linked protein
VRLRITFRKGQEARFLSHLDLMATLEYSVRRAQLPVELSEGFNPRPRMSIAAPLPLGYEGEREILELGLREALDLTEIQRRIQTAVPPGITILKVEEAEPGKKSAASRLRGAIYRVALPGPVPHLEERVEQLLGSSSLTIQEEREEGTRTRDLRPLLVSMRAADESTLELEVQFDESGTVRPEQILRLLEIPSDGARITRERLLLAP